jgi:hypothetical protein
MNRKNPNPESLRQFSAGIQPKIDPGFRTSEFFRISAIGFRHFSIA